MAVPSSEEVQTLVAEVNAVAQAYSTAPDLDGYMARVRIIDKAKKLTRALMPVEQTPNYHGLNMAELIAIRTFLKLKIFEAIPPTGSISLQDLSRASGAQESLIERMGRILVATGFLDQTRPDGGDYEHTKFSLSYIVDTGPGQLFLAMYDEWLRNMVNFDDYLEDRGQVAHAREPEDPYRNPYTWTHKQDGTAVWAIMAQRPEKIRTFQVGLAGLDVAIPVVGHFNFSLLKLSSMEPADRIELIDLGGGHGACLKQILAAHPDLTPSKCMLQERPDVVQMVRSSGALPSDVILMNHDFWTPQPIKGAKGYFMRMIMHDYADDRCVEILSHLAAAMALDSRVLICDMVLPQRVWEADFAAAVLDQAVMTMGGKERTDAGFKNILDRAGLELVQVWRVPGVPGACVEGRLKR